MTRGLLRRVWDWFSDPLRTPRQMCEKHGHEWRDTEPYFPISRAVCTRCGEVDHNYRANDDSAGE